MEEINLNELKNLQKIADSIQNLKNLRTINFIADSRYFGSVLIVENNHTKIQYTIKIISIFDGYDDICQEKLENAKKEADFLMQCIHPNVVKYIDQFQIHFNYFIQIEKCEQNLEQWINYKNNIHISRHQFISFACQTLTAIQYFHSNNYVLRDFSLQSILIDRNNRIKLCDFGLAKNVYSEINQKKFLKYCPKDGMFYFPPEIINQSEEQRSTHKGFEQCFDYDIWAFGICFSILGGATIKDCQQIHHSGYKYIKSLDQNINQILSKILSQQPNERPSIQKIIKEFEILKQEIWNPQQASVLFTEHQKILNQNIQKALELILICVDILPENINYQFQLGKMQNELKYFDESIKSFEKCLEINPMHNSCYLNLGNVFKNKGMVDKAIKSYQKYLEINPKSDICYYNLGIVYDNKGMVDEAIQSYQKCLEINPKSDDCYHNLGIVYSKKGNVDEAIKFYLKYIEINPKYYKIYFILGLFFFHKGMMNETIKSFQKCLEINPKYYKCYHNLGFVYQKKGMMDEAIKQYQKSLNLNTSKKTMLESQIKICKQNL